jgi:hypothetical protein
MMQLESGFMKYFEYNKLAKLDNVTELVPKVELEI